MNVKLDRIQDLLQTAAGRFVSPDEAAYFARLVLDAHLKKAPRMNPLQEAVDDLGVWAAHDGPAPEVEADNESVLLLDLQGLAPSLKFKYVHDELERRARKNGMAALGFRNSSGIITLCPWADGLAERDLIGVAMFDGGTGCTVPFGGTVGVFGTLPFAYAVPTAGEPVAVDMAMTEIPYFELQEAKDSGTPLREGLVVDGRGLPTTDAAAALDDEGVANLLPIGGGFKGYGLAMLLEILTGSLIRGMLSTSQTPGWHPPEYGALVLAFDVAAFTDVERFKREVSDMCEHIRRLPGAEGNDRPAIPGERGHAKIRAARAAGEIPLKDELVEALERLAGA